MTWERLAPRALALFYARAAALLAVLWLPLAAIGGVLVGVGVDPWAGGALGAAVAGVASLWTLWGPHLRWSSWGLALADDRLLVVHGVVLRQQVAIPLARIQHVDTRQGPVEQLLGLARVQVYTASGMGADASIPGLTAARAAALRDALVSLAESDDGV